MKPSGPLLKYIVAPVVLLGTFVCGYHFRQWYAAKNKVPTHISLIYSASEEETGGKRFEKLLQRELRKQGIEPVLDKLYLGSERSDRLDTTDHIRKYFEILKTRPADLILVVGDQATDALLSTRDRLLYSLPIVACNVQFPDQKRIDGYDSRKLYVLRDRPDFQRNMEFIRSLQPDAGTEIVCNIDLTPLGRKSFDLLSRSLDRKNVRIQGSRSTFTMEREYRQIREMTEYYDLMPALAGTWKRKPDETTVSLCPFRYIKGSSLLVMMEQSKREKEGGGKAFLLDKFDRMALPIVNALNIPSFSCTRGGFGGDSKIVGGYMATDEISAPAAAELSVRLLRNEKVGMPKVRDLPKEYVVNWRSFAAYGNYDIGRLPKNVRIVNYPLLEHYRKEFYFLAALFILTFIFVSISLLRTRRRALNERRNLKILEQAHKRLALSTDGGRISLWNMQGEEIEFDENFRRLTGIEKRRFRRSDFQQYVHPDDLPLLGAFYHALLESEGEQVARIRFCFREKDGYAWYELRCRSLKDVKGEMMQAGIVQNIEELVRREQQLIQAKQLAEKAELKQSFLNSMSHQIRTPLNAIVGFTNVLTGDGAEALSPDEKASMLEIVNENNDLLLKLIDDMLEISHLGSHDLDFDIREWDMSTLVREIYTSCRPMIRPELLFELEMDDTAPLPVRIDRIRFNQVISNFLNNANKFTREGRVVLGCKADRARHEVCVYVKDSGKGIEEKDLMMIFDRFYKTDHFEQGSGLGLAICKVIIERLSGRIEVDSEPGRGSCFSVILSIAGTSEQH